MKKILLLFALLLATASAIALQDTPIASQAVGTGVTVSSTDQVSRTIDRTMHVILSPTAVTGAATATIAVDGRGPLGTYYNILTSAATALVANTPVVLKVGIGLTPTANVVANDMVPPVYRITVLVGGAGTTATFSVSRSIN